MSADNRMIIDGGEVTLSDGSASQIDFRGVDIRLGPDAVLHDCMLDSDCTVKVIK